MELLFSYLSRWGLTKYMLAYCTQVTCVTKHSHIMISGRDEFLTEAAVFWKVRKVKSLPKVLVQRLDKV